MRIVQRGHLLEEILVAREQRQLRVELLPEGTRSIATGLNVKQGEMLVVFVVEIVG